MKMQDLRRLFAEAPARHDDEWADKLAGEMTPEFNPSDQKVLGKIGKYDLTTNGDAYSLSLNQKVVAYIQLIPMRNKLSAVMSVYTHPSARKEGLARSLYEYVLTNVSALQTLTPLTTGSSALWMSLSKKFYSYLINKEDTNPKNLKLVKDFSKFKNRFDKDPNNRYHFLLSAQPIPGVK